jgi:hypothetical protein
VHAAPAGGELGVEAPGEARRQQRVRKGLALGIGGHGERPLEAFEAIGDDALRERGGLLRIAVDASSRYDKPQGCGTAPTPYLTDVEPDPLLAERVGASGFGQELQASLPVRDVGPAPRTSTRALADSSRPIARDQWWYVPYFSMRSPCRPLFLPRPLLLPGDTGLDHRAQPRGFFDAY